MLFHKNIYKTLNLIEISKKALINNYNYFQKLQPNSKICPVLKSNAYGHGLKLIGKFVDKEIGPEFVCVDSLYEAYELKKADFKGKILIMGWTFPENFKYQKIDFRIPLFDLQTISILNDFQDKSFVHIKIDSGMNRLGIKEFQFEEFSKELKKRKKVIVEGIYSHLSESDNQDESFTLKQIKRFKNAVNFFEEKGFSFKYKHLFATAAAFKYKDDTFNLTRLGLGFYGVSPFSPDSEEDKKLNQFIEPALSFKTHLAEIKIAEKNERLGYGNSYIFKKKTKIGLLPLGYYDGLDRRLSNKGYVLINDVECKIIGRICMNIAMIDLSFVDNAKVDQEVLVYSGKNRDPNSLKNLSLLAETIPYELMANLSETTRRVLI